MIFFKSKRINDLELEVKWLRGCYSDLHKQIWDLRRDLTLVTQHLNVNFEDVKAKRRLVAKGGPERGDP